MNQKWCRGCPHLDFNEMSDEMYCKLKDYEQIRLRWHKHRPDWCPLVTGAERGGRMSVLIKHMAMPKGCIYANDKDQTEYCPLLNHDDVPFCQYIETEPEIAIGIDERPVYCPLSDVPDTNVGDTISRQVAIDALTHKWDGMVTSVFDVINSLPSAQPEKRTEKRTETHACDCIDRQAAIDALEKVAELYPWRVPGDRDSYSHYNEGWNDAIGRAEIALEELPSAQPEQRWIPCSERLPEDLEEVNVTWVNHDPEPYYSFIKDKPFTATAVYYKEKWYWYSSTCADVLAEYGRNPNEEIDDGIEIIAWMPLPEQWKGKRL